MHLRITVRYPHPQTDNLHIYILSFKPCLQNACSTNIDNVIDDFESRGVRNEAEAADLEWASYDLLFCLDEVDSANERGASSTCHVSFDSVAAYATLGMRLGQEMCLVGKGKPTVLNWPVKK